MEEMMARPPMENHGKQDVDLGDEPVWLHRLVDEVFKDNNIEIEQGASASQLSTPTLEKVADIQWKDSILNDSKRW